VLKQPQYSPLPVEKQVLIIYAGTNGMLDDLPVDQCRTFESEMYRFMESTHASVLQAIAEKKTLDDALKTQLNTILKEFKQRFVAQHAPAAAAV
jgi:F-type H+-transporting ATPase subunit alpha